MKLSIQRLSSGKIKITADGKQEFSVPEITWYRSGFSDGDDVNEEELLSLKEEGYSSFAYETALRLLTVRAHSEKELFGKLKMKYSSSAAAFAVEKCGALGLIDDEKFAMTYARELYENKHYAESRIRAELSQKGIDREIAENAINSLELDKNSAIMKILNKMRLSDPLSEKDKNRAIRRLLSMGYSMPDIRKHLTKNS